MGYHLEMKYYFQHPIMKIIIAVYPLEFLGTPMWIHMLSI